MQSVAVLGLFTSLISEDFKQPPHLQCLLLLFLLPQHKSCFMCSTVYDLANYLINNWTNFNETFINLSLHDLQSNKFWTQSNIECLYKNGQFTNTTLTVGLSS